MTTSWSWLRECQECAKLSSRQRVATMKNLKYKIYFDLFNTFLVTTWFHVCYFIVSMSSLLFYNVENSTNKEKSWKVCPNFWLVLYVKVIEIFEMVFEPRSADFPRMCFEWGSKHTQTKTILTWDKMVITGPTWYLFLPEDTFSTFFHKRLLTTMILKLKGRVDCENKWGQKGTEQTEWYGLMWTNMVRRILVPNRPKHLPPRSSAKKQDLQGCFQIPLWHGTLAGAGQFCFSVIYFNKFLNTVLSCCWLYSFRNIKRLWKQR